jgi:hypothetical protein
MPMYVKKPIPIEARQITVENAEELSAWSKSDVIFRPVDGSISGMMVYTLEGTMTGSVGDYLIKGVRGEFYFCAKDIFEETYDLAQEPPDPWHIEVLSETDHEDGGATFEFLMGEEAQKCFTRIGILKALRDQADRVTAKELDIDTNVGC